MLGVLFALVMTTGSFKNGLFGLIIIANSGIGIIQEIRAQQTLDRLSIVGQAKPTVRRDGVAVQVAPGGNRPRRHHRARTGRSDRRRRRDGGVRGARRRRILLTGEADAVDKAVGDKILSGSFVVSGSGSYRATKVGSEAYA